jgi:hypothetical protein
MGQYFDLFLPRFDLFHKKLNLCLLFLDRIDEKHRHVLVFHTFDLIVGIAIGKQGVDFFDLFRSQADLALLGEENIAEVFPQGQDCWLRYS